MIKKFSIMLIAILVLIGLSKNVFAVDKYNATSSINGVTANWEYELNDSNQIYFYYYQMHILQFYSIVSL